MKTIAIAVITIVLFTEVALAQTTVPADTTHHYGWKHVMVAGLNANQVALDNWEQGGENAFAGAAQLNGQSVQDEEHSNWTSSYSLAFGEASIGKQGLRKTDDKIDLQSVVLYKVYEDSKLNPYGAVSLKTQFATGYEYDSVGRATAVSSFFDPGYFQEALGASYKPIPQVTTRLGAALREIITNKYPKYSDDPATPQVETFFVEGGLESVTNLALDLQENMLFTSELSLFAPFKTFDQIVVRNSNTVSAKISKYLVVLLSLQLINEPRVSPLTQIKESFALGITYSIL